MSWDHGPARDPGDDLGEPVNATIFIDPWPEGVAASGTDKDHPESSFTMSESIELAYVAVLQHLPTNQRAVLRHTVEAPIEAERVLSEVRRDPLRKLAGQAVPYRLPVSDVRCSRWVTSG